VTSITPNRLHLTARHPERRIGFSLNRRGAPYLAAPSRPDMENHKSPRHKASAFALAFLSVIPEGDLLLLSSNYSTSGENQARPKPQVPKARRHPSTCEVNEGKEDGS
jgi:hypothetical protein